MASRNINLTDALDRFVTELVQSGSYRNASEVVRAGLRLLKAEEETRARKLEAAQKHEAPRPKAAKTDLRKVQAALDRAAKNAVTRGGLRLATPPKQRLAS